MTDLNQQIAKIDDVDVCDCGEQWHRGGDVCLSCDGLLHTPDYLAPENLHELVRIVLENGMEFVLRITNHKPTAEVRKRNHQFGARVVIESPVTLEKISAALAKAIVETE